MHEPTYSYEEEQFLTNTNIQKDGGDVKYGFKSAFSQLTVTFVLNLLLFLLGMSFAMPTVVIGVFDENVALNSTKSLFPDLILTAEESSWIGSILFLFHPFGAVISGYVVEILGRKTLIILVGFPFLVGWIILYLANSVTMLMIATISMGLGIGCCEAPIISYIGEISEPRMRGSLSVFAGAACNFGVLIFFLVYAVFDWKNAFLYTSVFPVITIIMLCFIPESPAWLISKGKVNDAEKSLRWLRGWSNKSKVMIEFNQIVKETKKASLFDTTDDKEVLKSKSHKAQISRLAKYLRRPEILRPFNMIFVLFIITIIASLQPMRPFLVEIFKTFGLPVTPEWVLVLTGLLNITGSIVSSFTVNKFGKRGMALWSTALNTIFVLAFSVCALNLHWPGWIPLTIICVSFWISGYGMLPLPWMLISEVYPLQVRGVACGITAASSSVVNFLATKTYINFINWFGLSGTLIIYTLVSFLGFFYIYLYLPETEDRTLQEIMDFFSENKSVSDFERSKKRTESKKSVNTM